MGIRERQDRERQAVRQAILEAARDLFITEGYRNVSIRKIAERIEYSPAAIYSYFPSKDDIFFALAEEGFRRLDLKIRDLVAGDDPLEDVRRCWWAYYEFSKEHREFFELMFVDRSVPQITDQWPGMAVVHDMLAVAAERIQRCVDAGIFAPGTDAVVALHLVWGPSPDLRSSATPAGWRPARIRTLSRAMCWSSSSRGSRPEARRRLFRVHHRHPIFRAYPIHPNQCVQS